jgi:hypothetical protein
MRKTHLIWVGFSLVLSIDSVTLAAPLHPSSCSAPGTPPIRYAVKAATADPHDGVEIALSAEPFADGLLIKLRPENGAVQAVTVFSEPSHRLLAVIVDKETTLSSDWLGRAFPEAMRDREFPLTIASLSHGSDIAAFTALPPEGDDHIVTHLRAWFPVDARSVALEEHFLTTWTKPSHFAFNYKNFMEDDGTIDPTVCCGDYTGGCGACIQCDGESWTCCLTSEPQCSWCGSAIPYCGQCFCPNC